MLKRLSKLHLRTKLIIILFGMFLLTIITENIYIIHIINKKNFEDITQKVESVAQIISENSLVISDIQSFNIDELEELQTFTEESRKLAKVEFITIFDMNGIRHTHPNKNMIGQLVVGGDYERALKGESYTSIATGTLGISIRAFHPIYTKDHKQVGAVLVGETLQNVEYIASRTIKYIVLTLILSLCVSIAISIWILRSVRKTLFGLDPSEIVKRYEEIDAIIHTVKEGIVVIDLEGKITQINSEAKRILGVESENPIGIDVESIIPNTRLYEIIRTEKPEYNYKQNINGIVILTNRTPLIVNGKVIGAVATFKDMTEVQTLAENLTGVNRYADALRSQSHEFINKLHVVFGLVFEDKKEELLDYLENIMDNSITEKSLISRQIKDPILSGFLNSKYSRARELGINLNYTIEGILPKINHTSIIHRLVTILGNLIDNSFDAVRYSDIKTIQVKIEITDEILKIQVIDSGMGISDDIINKVFDKGFSTKGKNRGIGLYLVLSCVEELGGDLFIDQHSESTMSITVSLPLSEIYQENVND